MLIINCILLAAAGIFAVLGYINTAPKYNSVAIICIVVDLLLAIGGKLI